MDDFISITTFLLFLYLILALLIERSLEVLVAIFNYIALKTNIHRFWNKLALRYRDKLDALYAQQQTNNFRNAILNWVLWKIVVETPAHRKNIVSADLIRLHAIRAGARIIGFALALGAIIVMKDVVGTDLIGLFNEVLNQDEKATTMYFEVGPMLSLILSAAALSIGTEPLHQLINRFEKRWV